MQSLSQCRVVLVRPEGPINVGMVCRAAANFGVAEIIAVAPKPGILASLEARQFAAHAETLLENVVVTDTLEAAVADCTWVIGTTRRRRKLKGAPTATLGAQPLGVATRGKVAVVFGNEAHGLTNDDLERCKQWLSIPAPGTTTSLNLSHAVAVTLYALANEVPPHSTPVPDGPAPQHEQEQLLVYWLETLERFNYFRRTDKDRFSPKLRRTLGRFHLRSADIQLLRGMLNQFNHVLEKGCSRG